jgi:hypothetical protein
MMNIALTDDLQRLLRKKVEDGPFSSEEAVIEEALKAFLIEETNKGCPEVEASSIPSSRPPNGGSPEKALASPIHLTRAGISSRREESTREIQARFALFSRSRS